MEEFVDVLAVTFIIMPLLFYVTIIHVSVEILSISVLILVLHLKLLVLFVVSYLVLKVDQKSLDETLNLFWGYNVWMQETTVLLIKKLSNFVRIAQEDQSIQLDQIHLLFLFTRMSFVQKSDLWRFIC